MNCGGEAADENFVLVGRKSSKSAPKGERKDNWLKVKRGRWPKECTTIVLQTDVVKTSESGNSADIAPALLGNGRVYRGYSIIRGR